MIRRKFGYSNYYSPQQAAKLLKTKLRQQFKTNSGEIDWKAASLEIFGHDRSYVLKGAVDFPAAYWKHVLIWEWVGLKRQKIFTDL